MVRAILDGRKTQTRRLVRMTSEARAAVEQEAAPPDWDGGVFWRWPSRPDPEGWAHARVWKVAGDSASAFGVPGDQLWVRETWADRNPLYIDADGDMHRASQLASMAVYRATESDRQGITWRPSIHMPRWASRLTLEITGVRVERLQDIGEADAKAEGVERDAEPCDHKRQSCADVGCLGPTYRSTYCELWDQLNAKRAPWASNPWIWCIDFTRIPP